MNQNPFKKHENLLPFLAVPIILVVCWFLWVNQVPEQHLGVHSADGIWDLRGIDFQYCNARLQGAVEFIPGVFLSPEEFAAREDEIIIGLSGGINQFATSRVRIIMPEDGYYTFSRVSTQHADRIFVNGLWLHDIGVPGQTREEEVPRTARIKFTTRPQYIDGDYIIEIVQHNSNFFHRVEGTPQHWNVGQFSYANSVMRIDFTQNIILGFFLTMSIVYLMLYFLLRGYRVNLYFALFCFTWFLRTGVTSSRVFTTILPWLGNTAMLRIEYIAIPVAGILICAIIHDLFAGVMQKYFRLGLYTISAGWIVVFLFGDSMFISYAIVYCQPLYILSIFYVIVRVAMKVRKPTVAQVIFLIGVSLFMYATIRDMVYMAQIYIGGTRLRLPPQIGAAFINVTMLAFAFCKAVALFSTTMKQFEEAKAAEREATESNKFLEKLSRMKTDFLNDIKHEVRNPLHIISIGTDFTNKCLSKGGMEQEARNMQGIIQEEAIRLGRMIEGMVELATESESGSHGGLRRQRTDIGDLLKTCAQNTRLILEQRGNALRQEIQPGLPYVYVDAIQLTRVLQNLFDNAENGDVTLSAKADGSYVTVCVSDTGEGIPAELLTEVFKRGVSGKGGKGYGLSICKTIVEAHSGTIEIESQQGKGTSVTFTIPVYGGQSEGVTA